jgi:hypothetical protein
LEILATVIPCWFLRITASIPVVLFDKSMSEADWILPVLMANWMAVWKSSCLPWRDWWTLLILIDRRQVWCLYCCFVLLLVFV